VELRAQIFTGKQNNIKS